MIAKGLEDNKMCLFCASDYHLEMILLPYIKERINNSKFIICTETSLEDTLNILLKKINISEKYKKDIRELNWKSKDDKYIKNIKNYINNNENVNIIINGKYKYIKMVNNYLKDIINGNINIIDCFHVEDSDIDIDLLKKEYRNILNTKKM